MTIDPRLQPIYDKLEKHFTDLVEEKLVDGRENLEAAKKEAAETLADVKKQLEMQSEQIRTMQARSLPGVNEEKAEFSFHKAFQGMLYRDWKDAGFEREVFDNMQQRAATASDGSSGGYLIPVELSQKIIEPALAAMPIYGLGIEVIDNVMGTFEIPVLKTRPDGGHTGENGVLSEIDYEFGEYRMVPHRGGGWTKISKRLIRQTGGSAESFIRRQLEKSVSQTIHKALVNGTGVDDEPKGVLQYSGFTSRANGNISGQLLLEHLRQMKTDLAEADFDLEMGRFGFLTREIAVESVTTHKTTYFSGQTAGKGYAFPQVLIGKGKLEELIGAPIATTTHVPKTTGATPTTSVVYGDWTHFILALWAGMELSAAEQISDENGRSLWLRNQVGVKAEQEYDCCIDLPAAFIKDSTIYASRSDFTNS